MSGPRHGWARSLARLLPAGLQRRLRRVLLTRRRSAFARRIESHRYGHAQLRITIADARGETWYGRDRDLEPEIRLLMEHRLRPGARVFNIGAHQGVVANVLAKIVGPTGHVLAVEPCSFDARLAQENCLLNHADNVQVLQVGVAASAGRKPFRLSGGAAHDLTAPYELADCILIDDLLDAFGAPDVVFMDIDGGEVDAFKGADALLKTYPDLYVEVAPWGDAGTLATGHPIAQELRARGFRLFGSACATPSMREFEPLAGSGMRAVTEWHLVALSPARGPGAPTMA